MQATTREWLLNTVAKLPDREMRELKGYVEYLVWKSNPQQSAQKHTGKNLIAQRIIKAMEEPPHVTHEDVEALLQSIEEGKMLVKFDSPFDEQNGQEEQ